ncbi:cobalamin-binding protein [Aliikangiella sp. IMCC44359]|uniref:cobalamin-binding protein n=1 Tax=Aliikangiella sp. IMCC44359 TaxID=3459125 RepID=UPI00403B1DBB
MYLRGILFFLLLMFSVSAGANTSKKIERIIALSPHSVEMLFAMGAGDKIVGTVEYADYPEAALKIPRIGSYTGLQIEKVVALKPDLIVSWDSGNKLADLKKLKSLGLNIFSTQPKDIQGISDDLEKLGQLIGHEVQAKEVSASIAHEHQLIKQQYKNKKKVKVFYQLWHDPLRTIGASSWIESLINDCNGNNLFNDADSPYPVVSFETVLKRNPEIIIIPHHSGSIGAKTEIWNNWSVINAVQNKQMPIINGDLLHRFGPRAVLGLKALCQAIDKAR